MRLKLKLNYLCSITCSIMIKIKILKILINSILKYYSYFMMTLMLYKI